MPNFVGFIIIALLLFFSISRNRERWTQFTAQEKSIIKRQTSAMTVPLFSLALAIFADINGQMLFLVSVPFLLYVGISAIVNQISIVRPKGSLIASTGPVAVLFYYTSWYYLGIIYSIDPSALTLSPSGMKADTYT